VADIGHSSTIAHVARDLEAGDLALAELDQFVLGQLAVGLQLHERGGDLHQAFVREAHDLGDRDGWVAFGHRLDLRRGDVLAPDLEHVLEAPEVGHPAIGIHLPDVAGVEPALVVDDLGGAFRVLVVALEHGVATRDDLAPLARGHLWLSGSTMRSWIPGNGRPDVVTRCSSVSVASLKQATPPISVQP
jgi:hypothetical protein